MIRKVKIDWLEQHNISAFMLAVLFLSETLNSYLFWLLLVVNTICYLIGNGWKIKIKNRGSTCILGLMFTIGLLGAIVTSFRAPNVQNTWGYIRDIIRFSSVPLTFVMAAQIEKKNGFDSLVLYTTLFFFCSVYGIVSMLLAVPNYLADADSLFAFAKNLLDQWVIAVGVFLSFFKPKCIKDYYIGRYFDLIAKVGLVALLAVSFSRTAFMILLCMIFPFAFRRAGTVMKGFALAGMAMMVMWHIFPDVAGTFIYKINRSFTEVASSSENWNDSTVVSNWRGYEVHCAKQEFSKYTSMEKLFGKGFGATVDAHGYARLVTSENSLPYLHNGYYTTLIKMGIVGGALNIMYWVALYRERKTKERNYNNGVFLGVIAALATSMSVIHGIFWGGQHSFPYYFWDKKNGTFCCICTTTPLRC